jgi:hypothetical protein
VMPRRPVIPAVWRAPRVIATQLGLAIAFAGSFSALWIVMP